jgi:lipoprotein-anchoring transpeptidase ErfK/SrfK
MYDMTKRISCTVLLALLLALCLTFGTSFSSYAATANRAVRQIATSTPQAGYTTGYAHVRTGTNTNSSSITIDAPNTHVTIYASATGQIVWGGISTWYRVSNLSSSSLYIYGGLIALSSNGGGSPPPPSAQGKVIVVSLSHQWLYAYQNGKMVFNAAAMTGRPSLATPTGTYHVFAKLSPTTFYSPWPPGSPYYYPPTHINYALEWKAGGYFLHDSWWHSVYGPGTNGWHYDPVYGWQWGTHGCVAMPIGTAAWLYNWAPIGTTVQINP